ncbi:MAG: rod-binding protein [Candidatus Sericytochromatia bacterium]
MMDNLPLVGSLSTGFGDGAINAPTARTPNLAEASQDFVGMLYSYMFSQMRENSSNEEDGLFSGPHVEMLMGFLDQEIGKELAGSQGGDLAKEMMTQMTGLQNPEQSLQSTLPSNASANMGAFDARLEGVITERPAGAARFDERLEGVVPGAMPVGRFDTRSEGFASDEPTSIDNSEQIMEELYKLNRRE